MAGFANDRAGIVKLIKRLRTLGATRIVVEATGGYEEPLLEACCDADVPPLSVAVGFGVRG